MTRTAPRRPIILGLPLGVLAITDGTGPDAPADASAPEAGDAGAPVCPTVSCGAGQKVCNFTCVSIDDPQYGCTPTGCGNCPGYVLYNVMSSPVSAVHAS